MVSVSAALRRQQAPGWSRSKAPRTGAGHNKEGDRVMKIASNIIVAAALVLASAPAFAHGGGMGGMGGNMGGNMGMSHGNGMTVTTQTHDWRTNVNFDKNTTKTTTKTIFRRIEFVRIRREILRLDREILRLIKFGKGNSPLVKGLEFQKAKLLQEGRIS
jgi:hypothetical protein